MEKKQSYVAPSGEVLFNLGDFILGSNDLPGDEFYPEGSSHSFG